MRAASVSLVAVVVGAEVVVAAVDWRMVAVTGVCVAQILGAEVAVNADEVIDAFAVQLFAVVVRAQRQVVADLFEVTALAAHLDVADVGGAVDFVVAVGVFDTRRAVRDLGMLASQKGQAGVGRAWIEIVAVVRQIRACSVNRVTVVVGAQIPVRAVLLNVIAFTCGGVA